MARVPRAHAFALAVAVVAGASLGVIVGSGPERRARAWHEVGLAADAYTESARVFAEVERLRGELAEYDRRFLVVMRELATGCATARCPDATAARAELFQIRVDMVAIEDQLAALVRRTAVAGSL
jgi:hypothetical protein